MWGIIGLILIVVAGVMLGLVIVARRKSAARVKVAADRRRDDEGYGFNHEGVRNYNTAYIDDWLTGSIVKWVGVGVLIVGLVVTAFTSFVTVPTRDIGVTTTFGAPVGNLSNGAHLKAPWVDVTMMDGAVQTDTHNDKDCDKVRIAHQIVACANVYIIWQINEGSVDELFKDFREFDNIRNTLVDKKLQSTLNQVFESYDPLAVNPTTGQSSAPELSVLSAQALDQMRQVAGDRITISDLKVTVLSFDDSTQSKINALQGQVAQTRIAEQAVQTAQQQAKANDELSKSVGNNPNVLVSKCLDTLNEMIAKGQAVPAGFSCWPGGGSSLVLPAVGAAK